MCGIAALKQQQQQKNKSQKPSHFKNLFTNIISEEQQQFSRSLYMQV